MSILESTKRKSKMFTPKLSWKEDLIMCPSQLSARIENEEHGIYTLYLRWRTYDPWSLAIIKYDGLPEESWYFVNKNDFPYIKCEDYKLAEYYAESFWNEHKDDIISGKMGIFV